MPFEIIFITEEPDATPAVEIQFNGQRLCVVRSSSDAPQLEFVQGIYVGRDARMVFPLAEFQEALQHAVAGLASWLQNLADGQAEA